MMKYEKELRETAKRLVAEGKGILAADESSGTIKKRLDAVGVENTETNRAKYRSLLFNTRDLNRYISGVICFEETLTQKDVYSGQTLLHTLKEKGFVVGVKVDKGLFALPVSGESTTLGFDDLYERSARFYEMGVRFAKWRNVFQIDKAKGWPSDVAVRENAVVLARYALVCQAAGLVPIVEPEILMDGPHSPEECLNVTGKVLFEVFKALKEYNVLFDGMLLKVNMVVPGSEFPAKGDEETVGPMTARVLEDFVPPEVPGIVFLSGGQSEVEATKNLNSINLQFSGRDSARWKMSFSYGRALQSSCLKTWKGSDENVPKAQEVLLKMAKNNWLAAQGKLENKDLDELDALTQDLSKASLYEKGYKY